MRERRIRKLMAQASKHRAASRPEHLRAYHASSTCNSGTGLDAETFRCFQLAGELFLLTSSFIEPAGWASESPREYGPSVHELATRSASSAVSDGVREWGNMRLSRQPAHIQGTGANRALTSGARRFEGKFLAPQVEVEPRLAGSIKEDVKRKSSPASWAPPKVSASSPLPLCRCLDM